MKFPVRVKDSLSFSHLLLMSGAMRIGFSLGLLAILWWAIYWAVQLL